MLQNNNGFTLIEILLATSILFFSLAFIIPSFMLLHSERQALYTEIQIVQQLEKELYVAAHDVHDIPFQKSEEIDGMHVTFAFTKIDQMIKGCVNWETNKETEKSTCLYKMEG